MLHTGLGLWLRLYTVLGLHTSLGLLTGQGLHTLGLRYYTSLLHKNLLALIQCISMLGLGHYTSLAHTGLGLRAG